MNTEPVFVGFPRLVGQAATHPPSAQCQCGRFAKWVGDHYHYNGQFDCYSYTVRCSHCGEVTVECV